MSESATKSISPSPGPSTGPANRHAPTAVEKQRMQLEKLLKDPAKAAYIPTPPKEKSIRPAREMMKNVQGSSAGAGSGEFHVYKAGRRREYERLKLMEETERKEAAVREFEEKKRQREEDADAKTAKNRAKRQKKKERSKTKSDGVKGEEDRKGDGLSGGGGGVASTNYSPKKRRLVSGKELVFRKPGEEGSGSEGEEGDYDGPLATGTNTEQAASGSSVEEVRLAVDVPKITIHDDE